MMLLLSRHKGRGREMEGMDTIRGVYAFSALIFVVA